jgi:RNA polymerase sigma-70 factor (ECF subfamily)
VDDASADTEALLNRAQEGDASAVQRLLTLYRGDLKRMVVLRMDSRLMGRIDPSDVVQEAAIEAARKLPEYLQRRDCAFYPWLRHVEQLKLGDIADVLRVSAAAAQSRYRRALERLHDQLSFDG